jgi:hypothetical protein
MDAMIVHVRLYGELSCYGNSKLHTDNYSDRNVKLSSGSTLKDLLDDLLMCTNERGFTFINEKMSAMPGVQTDLETILQNGDQILFFPLKMLPTQLHFDFRMTDKMTRTVGADEDLNLYYLYE